MTLPSDSPSLPEPGPNALEVSGTLETHIRDDINNSGGWIPFSRFMHQALYAPGLGYYSAGSSKFGPEGDFVTAPETSTLFGMCLGQQVGAVFEQTGLTTVLELGAGTGKLAARMLRTLANRKLKLTNYFILEVSGDLKARQQQTIAEQVPEFIDQVIWLDTLPDNFRGVVIANEVLDALPVDRFLIDEYGVVQNLGVTWKQGFQDAMRPASGSLLNFVRNIQEVVDTWPADYRSEVCLQLEPWLQSVLAPVNEGIAFFIDYGLPRKQYYLADRSGGTLMCYYRHRAHQDPYYHVGLQDISAWVDFSHLAQVAHQAGFEIAGFTTQAHFLLSMGSGLFQQAMDQADEQSRIAAAQEIKTLTMPGEMGERFKVLAVQRDLDVAIDGFSFRDFRWAL